MKWRTAKHSKSLTVRARIETRDRELALNHTRINQLYAKPSWKGPEHRQLASSTVMFDKLHYLALRDFLVVRALEAGSRLRHKSLEKDKSAVWCRQSPSSAVKYAQFHVGSCLQANARNAVENLHNKASPLAERALDEMQDYRITCTAINMTLPALICQQNRLIVQSV